MKAGADDCVVVIFVFGGVVFGCGGVDWFIGCHYYALVGVVNSCGGLDGMCAEPVLVVWRSHGSFLCLYVDGVGGGMS